LIPPLHIKVRKLIFVAKILLYVTEYVKKKVPRSRIKWFTTLTFLEKEFIQIDIKRS